MQPLLQPNLSSCLPHLRCFPTPAPFAYRSRRLLSVTDLSLLPCPPVFSLRCPYLGRGSAAEQLRRYLMQATSPRPRLARSQRRQRTTFTHEQTLRLEMEYHVSEYISRSKRFQLAELLDLTENQIKIWFQNRRAKDKRIEKAICEQQLRFVPSSPASRTTAEPGTHNPLSNCSTCHYTKQQFADLPLVLPRDQ